MADTRVKLSTIVQNQLPEYVRNDYPLVAEFLKEYYRSQEYQGAPVDLINNIKHYIDIDNSSDLNESVILKDTITSDENTIEIDALISTRGTHGFPDSYGLLKINDEIITYTGKTDYSFTGCIRGFSGIISLENDYKFDEVNFSATSANIHAKGSEIKNLSVLFLKEFLLKTKKQIVPGFEDRKFVDNLNENNLIKNFKDFYVSKGTERSFEIIFRALYGKDVKVIQPSDYVIKPSDSNYLAVKGIVVEPISGDPSRLKNLTLYQDFPSRSYAPIAYSESVGVGKSYYRLDIDSGYDRDARVKGTVYGNFKSTPKTRVLEPVSVGSSILDVESTVGFAQTGNLYVTYSNGSTGTISYKSKNLTQFFDCDFISGQINSATEIIDSNSYAYADDGNERIVVAITNILSDFDLPINNRYYQSGDVARIKSLGIYDNDYKSSTWIYNNKSTYTIKSISKLDTSDNSYSIQLNNKQYLNLLDKVEIVKTSGDSISAEILELTSDTSLNILTSAELDLNVVYTLRRILQKGKSQISEFSNIENFPVNVQSVYKDTNLNCRLFASSSIPSKNIAIKNYKLNISGTFLPGESIGIANHGFYTGDKVFYETEKISSFNYNELFEYVETIVDGTKLFDEGEYYVYRVDANNIKLAKSSQDIFYSLNNPTLSKFLRLSGITTVSNNFIQKKDFENKNLMHQKLFRKFDEPSNIPEVYQTKPGYTGMLVNGVEILNYKSKQKIYYGEIESTSVIYSDNKFDIINPPNLIVSDISGIGATGNFSVRGNLKEIRLLDRGFDYDDVPIVSITGGNGTGAQVQVSMKTIDHIEDFSAEGGNISAGSSVIGFSTYHKFKDNEQVKYITNELDGISGLTTNTNYFVKSESNTQVKLYKNLSDSISGSNPIIFSASGSGNHSLQAINKKSIINSINVINGGENYENKLRACSHTGINTSNDQITILNHGYSSGEIIEYVGCGTTSTPVTGISTNEQFYVTKIDSDTFKLSQVGAGSTEKEFFYENKKYVGFTSTGNGFQFFNYPEIKVSVVGKVGISSIGTKTFDAKVQPIFRGSIETIDLYEKGVGYGVTNIIDFNRKPTLSYSQGSGAELSVMTYLGVITEVIVLRPGSGYISSPDLVIEGVGNGAVLTPIVENGEIKSVFVVEGGRNYNPFSTKVTVVPSQASSRSKFDCEVQKWNINLFEKEFDKISSDDGIFSLPVRSENGIQYSHLYAPRYLRSSLYSNSQDGEKLYGIKDLQFNKVEIDSSQHSPIIGWAYDGNPIYGPYGFVTKTGGSAALMQSGYVDESNSVKNRPPKYPAGFFVEDYVYYDSNSETVLDENNGRFCITPEFPNGTYAYFATINSFPESSGPFINYRKPKFPYLVGKNFYSKPIEFNFDRNSTQDVYDINDSNYIRITDYYNLFDKSSTYPYISLPGSLNQTITVNSTQKGKVDRLVFENEAYGENYAVNDIVTFLEDGTGGSGANAVVSFIKGKSVLSIENEKTTSNIEIYPSDKKGVYVGVATTSPHEFSNNELISIAGLSTSSTNIEGAYSIRVPVKEFNLAGVGTTTTAIESITEDVIYLRLSGLLKGSNITENDILQIGTEEFKILNVDEKSSRVRVRRSINGISGLHTVGTAATIKQRKFEFTSTFNTEFRSYENVEVYFDPNESLGLGNNNSTGAGRELIFSNPGSGIVKIFAPTQSIYLKNHPFKTNDSLTYTRNGGNSIFCQYEDGSTVNLKDINDLYAYRFNNDFIGLSTVKIGLTTDGIIAGTGNFVNSRLLYFTGIGTGVEHNLRTNYPIINGNAIRNKVTVSTATTHGMSPKHIIDLEVNPTTIKTVDVKYSDYYRNTLLNTKEFNPSDVSEEDDVITIVNHEFENGQKVIYNSPFENPQQSLSDDDVGLFYVIKIDGDRFKLSREQYNSISDNPTPVGLASTSGSFSAVNPRVFTNGNKTIEFNLNDPSLAFTPNGNNFYPAFKFKIYSDKNYSKIWETSQKDSNFNYTVTGQVGVDAKATLNIDDFTPSVLYYKLEPIIENSKLTPVIKREAYVDNSVNYFGEIHIVNSKYSGRHNIQTEFDTLTQTGNTKIFTFNLPEEPEKSSYTKDEASISYETDCTHTTGPIARFNIINGGNDYSSLPGIENIFSVFGTGAIIRAESETIGKISSAEIDNFGFDFPHDKSLIPIVYYPQVLKIEPFASIESIGISSSGKGYLNNPKLVVIDAVSKKQNKDIELTYKLGDTNVEVLNNAYNLNNSVPRIVPIRGASGIGATFIDYNELTKDITITLDASYETGDTFPFEVNDKILVEGSVNVGVGSTLRGYNSKDYDYQLFTIKSVDPDYFGFTPQIVANIEDLLDENEPLGEFDFINSAVSVTAEKNFPIFDVQIRMNEFIVGEKIKSNNSTGIIDGWDSNSSIARVSSTDTFDIGQNLIAFSSNSVGKITDILSNYESSADYSGSVEYDRGFDNNIGFLNEITQRIQDSDYYQNFSYSLKSTVPFASWNNDISSLNHPVGYRKFSDYQIESASRNNVGLSTSVITTLRMFINDIDVNSTYSFDIVNENSIGFGDDLFSTDIGFYSRNLSNYNEAQFNRVLNVDDISLEFNSTPRSEEFTKLTSFLLEDLKYQRFFTLIRDRKFVNEKQLSIIDIVNNEVDGFINQYAILETNNQPIGGFFDYSVSSGFGNILYYPDTTKSADNDFDITYLSYELENNFVGVGTTTLGNIATISKNSIQVSSGTTETIVSVGKSFSSIKLFIGIDPNIDTNDNALVSLNLTHNQTNLSSIEYGRVSTSNVGYGTFNSYLDGDLVKVDFIPGVGFGQTGYINTIQVGLTSDIYTGLSTVQIGKSKIEAKTTEISSSGTPGIHTVSSYISTEGNSNSASVYFVQVADTTNNIYQSGEIVVFDTINSLDLDIKSFNTEFALIDSNPGDSFTGLGTFGTRIKNNQEVELTFTPNANIDVVTNILKQELAASSNLLEGSGNLTLDGDTNPIIVANQKEYIGTRNVIKDTFNLLFEDQTIFSREFDGSSADVVDVERNLIQIPGHFFTTGEKVDYVLNSDVATAIGIATTSFVGVADTTLLPTSDINELYIIKKDSNKIGFATNAEDSLKKVPRYIDFESLGSGTNHKIISHNQNSRSLITLDNFIQSPITLSSINTTVKTEVSSLDTEIVFSGISSFLSADFIQINDEIMKIQAVGVGTSANSVSVIRGKVGTSITSHPASSTITKVFGNYLIKDNKISFTEAPSGLNPVETSDPSENDWTGIAKGSSFSGRVFMKGPIVGSSTDTYSNNYVFNDISHQFTGVKDSFDLDAQRTSYITNLVDKNAIILLNSVFQTPLNTDGLGNYSFTETTPGQTKLNFSGDPNQISDDIGVSNFPKGGVIQSIGSTSGFGYQPLVAAGGTSIISGVGTISNVSVATSGSGYRGSSNYQILTDTNSTISIGSTEIYVDPKNSILELTELLLNNSGSVVVSIGTYIRRKPVVSVGNTYIRIGEATTSDKIIPTNTQVNVVSTGHQVGFVNVSIATSDIGSGAVPGLTYDVLDADYSPTTGLLSITLPKNHELNQGDYITINDNSLRFTCASDNNTRTKSYPRPNLDTNASGRPLKLKEVNGQKALVFVGFSTFAYFNVSDATYNHNNGDLELTIGSHNFVAGRGISLETESLTFTCAQNSHGSNHAYPRSTDPAANTTLDISAVTSTTITVNVGTNPATVASGIHTFVSATANAVRAGGQYTHTFVSADSDAIVSVATTSIQHIGFATIITGTGHISDNVTITNPGTGYTTTNTPIIEFDGPLSYENIPLVYNKLSVVSIAPSSIYRQKLSGDYSNWYLKIELNKSDLSKIKPGVSFYTENGNLNGQTASATPIGASDAIYILIDVGFNEPNLIDIPSGTEISIGSEFISGDGKASTMDIVVGNGSSVIDVKLKNTGYSYKLQESLTAAIGGLTGIPTTSSYDPFTIDIQSIHNDTFNGWSVGLLQRLDDLSGYLNGKRKEFPLFFQSELISIVPSRASAIDIQYTLLVFVNDILQNPGESYAFNGGSYIRFSEPLKEDDTLTIFYYKGNEDDSEDVEVVPTVEPGDQLQITSDNRFEVEDQRTVSRIRGSRTATTTQYYGPGNVDDPEKYRPVIWSRQTEDKIVAGNIVDKARTLYEPYIVPTSYLINDVGVGITEFYFDSIRPIFNPQNESSTSNFEFQNEINIISTEVKVAAAATAIVSGLGTVSSIVITDSGSGYTSATVSIASTVGTSAEGRATATAVVSAGGTIQSISVTSPGTGYTSSNPPIVLISIPEMVKTELCEVHSYNGDEGRIVGFATTNASDPRFVFDLYMPPNKIFKNTDIVSNSGITSVTDLAVGDFFVVKNSNVGIATTSIELYSTGFTRSGISTQFIDGVYYVDSISTETVEFLGITTTIKRIESRVGDNSILGYDFTSNSGMTTTSGYFGEYSWGKIVVRDRERDLSHPSQTDNGYIGINTSTRVSRKERLKFKNYNV